MESVTFGVLFICCELLTDTLSEVI